MCTCIGCKYLVHRALLEYLLHIDDHAMKQRLLELMRKYRYMDRAVLFMRLFIGGVLTLRVIDKLQTYDFIIGGYPTLLFDNNIATFIIFTALESVFAAMIMCGFGTRFAAFIMSLGMFVEAFVIFPSLGWLGVERQVLYIAIYMSLVISGGGRYALDDRLQYRRRVVSEE